MIALPAPKPGILARREEIVAALRDILPGDGVIADALRLKPYETDGLAAYRQIPLAVVLPRTTGEVAAVLRYCHENGVRVVRRKVSKQDMAKMVGASREMVSRVMKDLECSGYIRVEEGCIVLKLD